MSESFDHAFETRVFRYLFDLAGLTEPEVFDLLTAALGGPSKIEPTDEDYARVPPVPVGSDDERRARGYRLAQAHAMLRIALAEKARQHGRNL